MVLWDIYQDYPAVDVHWSVRQLESPLSLRWLFPYTEANAETPGRQTCKRIKIKNPKFSYHFRKCPGGSCSVSSESKFFFWTSVFTIFCLNYWKLFIFFHTHSSSRLKDENLWNSLADLAEGPQIRASWLSLLSCLVRFRVWLINFDFLLLLSLLMRQNFLYFWIFERKIVVIKIISWIIAQFWEN